MHTQVMLHTRFVQCQVIHYTSFYPKGDFHCLCVVMVFTEKSRRQVFTTVWMCFLIGKQLVKTLHYVGV